MNLNTLSPAAGSKRQKKRVGRGIGSGLGKTCGRGHKGLKSRSGGSVKPGFEGGQMPLQRRVPKYGFSSRIGRVTEEIRLSEINQLNDMVIDIEALKKIGLIRKSTQRVKIIKSGEVTSALRIKTGVICVTAGAKAVLELAGGTLEA